MVFLLRDGIAVLVQNILKKPAACMGAPDQKNV